eukprot:1161588-Prymnesium_polylepis.1
MTKLPRQPVRSRALTYVITSERYRRIACLPSSTGGRLAACGSGRRAATRAVRRDVLWAGVAATVA